MKKITTIIFLILIYSCVFAQVKVKNLPTKSTNFLQGDNIIIDDSAGVSGATKKITVGQFKSQYGFVSGSSTNPTSSFLPYNLSGVFQDSYLSQDATYLYLANNKNLANPNLRSVLSLGTGSASKLAWNQAETGYISINNSNNTLNHSALISFDAPQINIAQAPSWASFSDTTNYNILFRSKSDGSIHMGTRFIKSTIAQINSGTDSITFITPISLKSSNYYEKSDTATSAQIIAGNNVNPLIVTTNGLRGAIGTTTGTIAAGNLSVFSYDMGMSNTWSPADATTYYWGGGFLAPTTTAIDNDIHLGYKFKIIGCIFQVVSTSTPGTGENVTLKLRNTTLATSTSIGTFTTNGGSTYITDFVFTGLNISVEASEYFTMQMDTPTWVTNPISSRIFCKLICQLIP